MSFPAGYPYSPPTFRFLTKMWHPNIYEVNSIFKPVEILVSCIEGLMIYSRFFSPVMYVFQFYIPLLTIRKVVNYLPSDGTRHKMSGTYEIAYHTQFYFPVKDLVFLAFKNVSVTHRNIFQLDCDTIANQTPYYFWYKKCTCEAYDLTLYWISS